jgi:di-heme oxidoreductase (putative peroxidase)
LSAFFALGIREAIVAHAGEALESRRGFERLEKLDQDGLIEFLKSLQALPAGTKALALDERLQPREWPPAVHRR